MTTAHRIWLVTRDEEIDRCFPVMVQLRPHLARREFVDRVRQMQADGYQLAALELRGVIRGVAGFRVYDMLRTGRTLSVDDLVTDQDARSEGVGSALLTWLKERARAESCVSLDLDSGVHRFGAHRFYHREGLVISSHHFSVDLKG